MQTAEPPAARLCSGGGRALCFERMASRQTSCQKWINGGSVQNTLLSHEQQD
jgi:hypothetical protein